MNKRIKRLAALLTTLIMMASVSAVSASAGAEADGELVTLKNAPQLCAYLFKNIDQGVTGPISVTKGTLRYNDDTYDPNAHYGGQTLPYRGYTDELSASASVDHPEIPVYLVCIAGTEIIGGGANNIDADLATGLNLPNQYEKDIRNIIEENVPKGSNLFIAGHSLGGMTAQQVAADKTLQKDYNILYTVTFGSPCVKGEGGFEGTLNRLCDSHDYVTYLSVNVLEYISKLVLEENALAFGASSTVTRDGGYDWQLNLPNETSAHTSYINEAEWGDCDVSGSPKGMRELQIDLSTCQRYKAPSASNNGMITGRFYNKGDLTLVWPLLEQAEDMFQKNI